MRIIVLTAIAAIGLYVFIFGIVFNEFGLFDDPDQDRAGVPSQAGQTGQTGQASGTGRSPEDGIETIGGDPAGSPPSDDGLTWQRPRDVARMQSAAQSDPGDLPDPSRFARNVTPPNVLSRPTSAYIDPAVLEASKAAEEEEKPTIRRYHRIVVQDARTLQSAGTTIRLAGIVPVAADRTCTDEDGQSWPCGRIAAAELRRLIRNRALDCEVIAETDAEIVGACTVGLEDLNGWLVEQGWAEAEPDAGYAEEAEAARTQKRGIHLADWQVKGTGGTGEVPQAGFTAPELPAQP